MRESRTYGSVRGALSSERPYRDPEQAGQSTPRPLKQHFDDGTCPCIDHCRASAISLKTYRKQISNCSKSPTITAFHTRLGQIENVVRRVFRCFKSLFPFGVHP